MTDLYVIGEGNGSGIVKIGKSGDVPSRLSTLQTGNPRKLQVLHLEPRAGHLEEWLHERFADIRLEGEWFDFGDDVDAVSIITGAISAAIERMRSARVTPERRKLKPRPRRAPRAPSPRSLNETPKTRTWSRDRRARAIMQRDPGITGADLARKLGVTPRQGQRLKNMWSVDLDAPLERSDVPVLKDAS